MECCPGTKCQVTVHYIPIIDLIIFLLSEETDTSKLRQMESEMGCVVNTSHVVSIRIGNNQLLSFPCTRFTGPYNSVLFS